MINKKIEEITIDDINDLIENCVCESKTLEYKQALTISNNDEKKEFLADISSFANSVGGDLVIGIEEDENDKIPTNICGISYQNEDELIRQIESLIRDSIQPHILNIQFRTIELEKNKCILIIRIPQSIISPHRLEFKNNGKFYTRNNKGKYPMDVNELRLAFNSGLDLNKRIENYKSDRYSNLIANRSNILKNDFPIFVVHYIPLSALNSSIGAFSVTSIKDAMNNSNSTILGDGYQKTITIDGISMSYNEFGFNALGHFKNNGIIEKATNNFFKKSFVPPNVSPAPTIDYINSYQLLNKLISDFNQVKIYYNKLGITAPIIISCALLNARDFTIPTRDFYDIFGKIDRDILYINDIYVEDLTENTEQLLKPIFDSIWNACGYERCFAYDEDGNFKGLK